MKRDRDLIPILVPAVFAALGILAFLTMLAPAFEPPPVTPTAAPSDTPTPTPTATPTAISPTPTVTETLQPMTPTLTPEFFNPNPGGDVFFTPYDGECELPCWQGLRVGESDVAAIQLMLNRVFSLDVSAESFIPYLESDVGHYEIAGTRMVSYWWELPDPTYPGFTYFAIDVLTDIETNTIFQGLHITQVEGDGTIITIYTPRQSLVTIGAPDQIYLTPEVDDHAAFVLVYNKGIVLHYSVRATYFEEEAKTKSRLCLNDPVVASDYYLVSPFEDIKHEPRDIVHKGWLWILGNKESSEEVLGLSAPEIAEIAMQTENPCFTIEEPK